MRRETTRLFAAVLRCIYDHDNWSLLYTFFAQRYSTREMLVDREMRKLTSPATAYHNRGNRVTVKFRTDLGSVGLPPDFLLQLARAGGMAKMSGGSWAGGRSIGPAISVAVGIGAYIDLVYCGKAPGKYPEPGSLGGLFGIEIHVATTGNGGRGRRWAEWARLWRVIADWVHEYEAASVLHGFLTWHTIGAQPTKEEERTLRSAASMSRGILSTNAIIAADSIRDVFDQLADDPMKLQGIEWDFLELGVSEDVRKAFYTRFGRKTSDHKKNLKALVEAGVEGLWILERHRSAEPMAFKYCPSSFNGKAWESWLLSIEGGDVAVAMNLFQVRTAADI